MEYLTILLITFKESLLIIKNNAWTKCLFEYKLFLMPRNLILSLNSTLDYNGT